MQECKWLATNRISPRPVALDHIVGCCPSFALLPKLTPIRSSSWLIGGPAASVSWRDQIGIRSFRCALRWIVSYVRLLHKQKFRRQGSDACVEKKMWPPASDGIDRVAVQYVTSCHLPTNHSCAASWADSDHCSARQFSSSSESPHAC
jgi:hypothetical protein